MTSPGWGDPAAGYNAVPVGKPIDASNQPLIQLLEDGFMIADQPNLLASRMPKGALIFQARLPYASRTPPARIPYASRTPLVRPPCASRTHSALIRY